MNEGQQKFYEFIMDAAQEGKEEEAKALLAESFGKQASGEFNDEYLQAFIPKMGALLKPDKVDMVMNVMKNYGPDRTN